MVDMREMGTEYTSDILVIGGSIAGLVTAIKTKEINPDLDVLVVDKGAIGWSGQAAKAGNGIVSRQPEQSVDDFMEFSIKSFGEYLNDQDYLRMHYENQTDYLDNLLRWGVNISKNPDGTVKKFPLKNNLWCQVGIELKNIKSLRAYALKVGVRLLSYVHIFDLLTDGDRVVGGVGMDSNNMKFQIFQAKAVVICTNGTHFKKMGGMFMGYGTGLGAAYRAGAHMRNAEFSTEVDVVSKANFTPIYGACNIIYNQNGENISAKYAPDRVEVSCELVMGMYKEVQEGRGPLYADLTKPDPIRDEIGAQGHDVNDQRLWPDKHHWVEHMEEKAGKYGQAFEEKLEATARMQMQAQCLAVDMEQKTHVNGLWGAGQITAMGCSYIGFVRGDGLGFAVQTGIRAAESMAKYVADAEVGSIDPNQVRNLKEKIYAPLHRKTLHKPAEIFRQIEEYAFHVDVMLAKSEKSIQYVLDWIQEMYKIVPRLSADDAHSLAKCHEAAECLLSLEFIFRAALMRKESRGGRYRHYRIDYPERNDSEWLKWINIVQDQDGGMKLFTEDVPMERYQFKPDGWVKPEY